MAELFCCRFAELSHKKAFRAEESEAIRCSRKVLKGANRCSLENPRKLNKVDLVWIEGRGGYGASLPGLASTASVFRCDYSIIRETAGLCGREEAFELQKQAAKHGNGNSTHETGYILHHDSLRRNNVDAMLWPSHASTISAATCHNENSRHASTITCAGDMHDIGDTLDLHVSPPPVRASLESDAVIYETHDSQPVRASLESDAFTHNEQGAHELPVSESDNIHNNPASFKNGRREARIHSQRASPNSSSTFPFRLVYALDIADNLGDVLSVVAPVRVSDLSLVAPVRVSDFKPILQGLKPSSKIAELFHWMKANCTTLDVHTMVFGELGKRREWTMLDCLLREEVKLCVGEAICEVFNKLFQVCVAQGAPEWASKWFHFMLQEGIQPDFVTFRLLMPLFKRYEMLEDAKFAYQHMNSVGVECSMASSAMLQLYICAHQFEKAKQIYNRSWDTDQEPLQNFFILRLNAYVRDGKVEEAEEIMHYMLDSGEDLDIFVYNLMITVNGKAGEYSRAREWFFRIEKDGLQPNETSYRSIIGACGRAGNLQDALCFYDKMVALHFSPSLVNYNTLIHLHRKVDNDGRIMALISDMKAACCSPDSATLNSVLKVYERYGRLEKLPEALQLLKEAGWAPSMRCYGFLIRAYIRCKLVDQAMEVFNKLCAVAELEEIMCHNLICMCKSVGRYDEAIHVFHEMRRFDSTQPCLRTSCAVIDVYSLKGAIEEGEALYKELRSERELDAVTYNVVLSMYLKVGLFEKAAEVLKEVLQQKGLQPDLYLFLCMLKVCTKCGMQEAAGEIYWRIVKSKVVWTESLYTGVIHCCGRVLPSEEIVRVFDAMVSAGLPINNVTCNLLLDIFGKAGFLEKAEYVLRLAQKQGVQDCITFSTIIDAYGKNKKFNEMEAIFTEMFNEGFKGCVEAYNSMLDAYGSSGQIGKMEKTLERMRIAGCIPNLTTFNTLIKVYGQEGLLKDLQSVLKRMEKAQLKLDSYTYTTLIHAYGNVNLLDESLKYFHEMCEAGFEPDLITYSCLISVLRTGGYGQEAARLSSWIRAEGF